MQQHQPATIETSGAYYGSAPDTGASLTAIEDEGMYDTAIAGGYLGFQSNTMRNSRSTGKLAGVDAPAFIKMGTAVRYKGETLKAWRAQFSEQTKTQAA